MSVEDYQWAIQVQTIKGERLPRGRALDQGELRELVRTSAAKTRVLPEPGTQL